MFSFLLQLEKLTLVFVFNLRVKLEFFPPHDFNTHTREHTLAPTHAHIYLGLFK